jgi:predicted nucleotidyltransferase
MNKRNKKMLNEIELDKWLETLLSELKTSFGARLLLAVLVGSRARDDANEQSDIDINVILDRVTPEDIILYREIIERIPDGQYACGYLGGLNEIKIWPRYDLMAFHYGCRILYGNADEIIGGITQRDIQDNALVTLSNINHASRHSIIYDKDLIQSANSMKALYKAAFFVIQNWYLLKYGDYVPKRIDLIKKDIPDDDRLVLEYYENWKNNERARTENPLDTIALLERWSSGMFDRLSDVKIETASVD